MNPAGTPVPGLGLWRAAKEILRRGCRQAFIVALRLRSQPLDTRKEIGSALIFSPHQDDEVLGCGGLVATLCGQGLPVAVAFITDGRGSHPNHPLLAPVQIGAQRNGEARAALAVLGLPPENIFFLEAPDGELPRLTPEQSARLTGQIAALVEARKPQTILLPYRKDGSSEHVAAYDHVRRALTQGGARPRMLEFPVWAWWNPLRLGRALVGAPRIFRLSFPGLAKRKLAALACYRSQVEPTPPWSTPVLSPAFIKAFRRPDEYFLEL